MLTLCFLLFKNLNIKNSEQEHAEGCGREEGSKSLKV